MLDVKSMLSGYVSLPGDFQGRCEAVQFPNILAHRQRHQGKECSGLDEKIIAILVYTATGRICSRFRWVSQFSWKCGGP